MKVVLVETTMSRADKQHVISRGNANAFVWIKHDFLAKWF